jgi:hypothetical protein
MSKILNKTRIDQEYSNIFKVKKSQEFVRPRNAGKPVQGTPMGKLSLAIKDN